MDLQSERIRRIADPTERVEQLARTGFSTLRDELNRRLDQQQAQLDRIEKAAALRAPTTPEPKPEPQRLPARFELPALNPLTREQLQQLTRDELLAERERLQGIDAQASRVLDEIQSLVPQKPAKPPLDVAMVSRALETKSPSLLLDTARHLESTGYQDAGLELRRRADALAHPKQGPSWLEIALVGGAVVGGSWVIWRLFNPPAPPLHVHQHHSHTTRKITKHVTEKHEHVTKHVTRNVTHKHEHVTNNVTEDHHHHHHQTEVRVVNKPVPGPRGPRGFAGERGRPGRDGRNGRDGRDGRDGRVTANNRVRSQPAVKTLLD